nr:MAG TPA: hypothetical protein [Caudoviricetes sp.]
MDSVGINAGYKPSLVKFYFHDENRNEINNIVKINVGESIELSVTAIFTGINSEFLNYSEPRDTRFINLCVYEKNRSGKGYKIIKFFSFNIDYFYSKQDIVEISAPLVTITENTQPLQGEFEGIEFDKTYNYRDTFMALKIFYSSEKVKNIEELDRLFNKVSEAVLDTKLPFMVVGESA